MWKLIDRDGNDVAIGSNVRTFRGADMVLVGFDHPRHSASTGRIYVTEPGTNNPIAYFPGVCDLKIVEVAPRSVDR